MPFVDTIRSFMRGARGEFMSLEQALTHPKAERQLIDLQGTDTLYDPQAHTVTYTRDGKRTTVFVRDEFHTYMDRYRSNIRYITDTGTPWLTRHQEESPAHAQQRQSYFAALSSGPNTEVAMVTWRGTSAKKKDTGHSALSFGTLDLATGSSLSDEFPIYEYTPEITGSFYPTITPALRPSTTLSKAIKREHNNPLKLHMDAARGRLEDNPVAHTMGAATRDFALPVGAGLGTGLALAVAAKMTGLIKEKKGPVDIDHAIKMMSIAILAYAAAKSAGVLKTSTGVVLLKEEEKGSGILASLITPAQLDIMQHALYGMYKTYHEKYNIMESNCADFADKMMAEIGLQTSYILECAIAAETPTKTGRLRQALHKVSIPSEVRPDRLSWAMRNSRQAAGTLTVDDRPLTMTLLDVSGQSSVLIETEDSASRFGDKPIETFQKILKDGLTVREGTDKKLHFEFQPSVEPGLPSKALQQGRGR